MSEQVSELFALAGVPPDDLRVRLRSLPPGVQALHQRVLLHLAENGHGPAQEQIADWAKEVAVEPLSAVAQLAVAELLFTDPAGHVIGGVPFAAQVTVHQVRSRDGQWSWQPPAAVVFLGTAGPGRVTDTCCPVINFSTTDNALTYQRDHHLQQAMLTFGQAVLAEQAAFGDLMTSPAATIGDRG